MRALVFLWIVSMVLRADTEVVIDAQNRLSGEFAGYERGVLTLKTPYAGAVTLELARLERVEVTAPVWLRTGAGESVRGPLLFDGNGFWVAQQPFEIAAVERIVPLAEIDRAVSSGFLDLSLQQTRGNVVSESHRADLEWQFRHRFSRHTLRSSLSEQTQNNQRTESARLGRYQYDHFVSSRWYLYGSAALQSDRFRGVQSRREAGAGAGYQFIDRVATQLSLDGGLLYEIERPVEGDEESRFAGRWQLIARHGIAQNRVQLFHDHETLFFENGEDYKIQARTGVRVMLVDRLSATLQSRDSYHHRPAEGLRQNDRAQLLTLGYRW